MIMKFGNRIQLEIKMKGNTMKDLLKVLQEKYTVESLTLLSPEIDGVVKEAICLGRIEMLAEIIRHVDRKISRSSE